MDRSQPGGDGPGDQSHEQQPWSFWWDVRLADTWHYIALGLHICSDHPIAGLLACPASPRPDLQIRLRGPGGRRSPTTDGTDRIWYESPNHNEHGVPTIRVWQRAAGGFVLCTADGVGFTVDGHGQEVQITWPPAVPVEDVIEYLLRITLAFVLLLRGMPCLHASAVAVAGGAVAIMGPSGAGKSTTATALVARGYPLISDDLVLLAERDGSFWTYPATSHIRLWPEAVAFLFGQPDALPRFIPDWDKRRLDLAARQFPVQDQPLPLAGIYRLGPRSDAAAAPRLGRPSFREGLMDLIANTYLSGMLDPVMRAQAFSLLGRLATRVPMRLLTPHSSIDRLPQLLDLMGSDLRMAADELDRKPPAGLQTQAGFELR